MNKDRPTSKIQREPGIPMSSYLRGAIDSLGDATSIPNSTFVELVDDEESKKFPELREKLLKKLKHLKMVPEDKE
jgi:hypothetical protein